MAAQSNGVLTRQRPPMRAAPVAELRRVTVRFGPIRIGLYMADAALSVWPWHDEPGLGAEVELELSMQPLRPPSTWQPESPNSPDTLQFSGHFITGACDFSAGRGTFIIHPRDPGDRLLPHHAHDGAKEAAILVAVELLTRRGGLAFHAAAIRVDQRAFVICGESGAGKSTLCSRIDDGWLGDEWALVAPSADGWVLWRWAQWHWRWPDEPWEVPLGGMLGLAAERDRTQVWLAGRADAVAMLIGSAYWLPWWPTQVLLDAAIALANHRPPFWLSHSLNEPVSTLNDALGSTLREGP